MLEHLYNLAFGLFVAFILPIVLYLLGLLWTMMMGGWPSHKFRLWWTTFCLLSPFILLSMMVKRMAEDKFSAISELWSQSALSVIGVTVVVFFPEYDSNPTSHAVVEGIS